jgi:drug/metabolite transporter (DMT)-like permease
VIGTLIPIATIALAAAILGEVMSGLEWLGAALIIAGVGWFTLTERR